METVAELQTKLAAAKLAESEERNRLRESVKLEWRFFLRPDTSRFDKIMDNTVIKYRLDGEVVNREQAIAAGHSTDSVRGGGITYLYNTGTNRFVLRIGGGTIYVGESWSGDVEENQSAELAMLRLAAFLSRNPDGGDVTDIVAAHRKARGF